MTRLCSTLFLADGWRAAKEVVMMGLLHRQPGGHARKLPHSSWQHEQECSSCQTILYPPSVTTKILWLKGQIPVLCLFDESPV